MSPSATSANRSAIRSQVDVKSAPFRAALAAMEKLLGSLRADEQRIALGGGPKAIERQHEKGRLTARERIALAVAEENGCNYCLSAHTYLGKNLVRLDDAEIAANRRGTSGDPKAEAAVRFAVELVRERGHVHEDSLRVLKAAGYDDAQVVEIVLHVALNTWTNLINVVGATDIDFPVVTAGQFG